MKAVIVTVLAILLILGIWGSFSLFSFFSGDEDVKILNFDDCVRAGNPVMESYPRRCMSESGELFIEDIGNQRPDGGA